MQYCYAVNDAFQGCTNQVTVSLGAPRQLPLRRHRRVPRGPGTLLAPAAQDNSLGTLLVTFTNLPSQRRLGGHGLGEHVQPGVGGRSPARHRRMRAARVALLRFRDDVARRHGARHRALAEPRRPVRSAPPSASTTRMRSERCSHVTVDVKLYDAAHRLARRQPGHALGHPARGAAPRSTTSSRRPACRPTSPRSSCSPIRATPSPTRRRSRGSSSTQDTDNGDTRFHDMQCSAGCF